MVHLRWERDESIATAYDTKIRMSVWAVKEVGRYPTVG